MTIKHWVIRIETSLQCYLFRKNANVFFFNKIEGSEFSGSEFSRSEFSGSEFSGSEV